MHMIDPFTFQPLYTWLVWPNGVALRLDAGLPHGVAGDDTWRLITASTETEALALAQERRKGATA